MNSTAVRNTFHYSGRTEKHCFPVSEESLDADVHSANGLV